jgi:tetratricopeptide (TPR) repeat protein
MRVRGAVCHPTIELKIFQSRSIVKEASASGWFPRPPRLHRDAHLPWEGIGKGPIPIDMACAGKDIVGSMKSVISPFPCALMVLYALIGCSTAPSSNPTVPTVDLRATRQKAWELIQNHAYSDAKALLEKGLSSLAEEREVPYIEDETLFVYGEQANAPAITLFLEIARDYPDSTNVQAWKSSDMPALIELEKTASWTRVKVLSPTVPYLYFMMGYVLIEKDEYEKARDYLEKAIKAWPDFTRAYNELLYIDLNTKNYEGAKRTAAVAQARILASLDAAGMSSMENNLGYIAIQEKQWDLAVRHYNRSLELDPDNKIALERLGYISKNRPK